MPKITVPAAAAWHEQPGITRHRRGKRWQYFAANGNAITDVDEIARLSRIALPPAYTDGWFAADPDAAILATGLDAKGRRQYRYNPEFRAAREAEKFSGCANFGDALPTIRARVEQDLRRPIASRERALASLVRLLDTTHIRIGNEVYARRNKSFGATTLRMRHAEVKGSKLALRFRAKSGRECKMEVSDRGLARFVRAMEDLPGQHLFQWLDADGQPHPLHSQDVNAYLQDISNEAITAKHFRTFAGSVLAYDWLTRPDRSETDLKSMLAEVSQRLNNTPAVARKSYIHPALITLARESARPSLPKHPRATRWLTRVERGFLQFLAATSPAP